MRSSMMHGEEELAQMVEVIKGITMMSSL